MKSLDEARIEIDAIDKELMVLFEKRMETVKDVALYKQSQNLPIFHPEREKQVIEKNVARLDNEALKPYVEDFLNEMMRVSKEYQSSILNRED